MAGGSIYDDILDGLEANGNMQPKERDRLILFALADIGRNVEKIQVVEGRIEAISRRVEILEKENIVRWLKAHPRVAGIIGIITAGLAGGTVWHLGLLPWVLRVIGIPVP